MLVSNSKASLQYKEAPLYNEETMNNKKPDSNDVESGQFYFRISLFYESTFLRPVPASRRCNCILQRGEHLPCREQGQDV